MRKILDAIYRVMCHTALSFTAVMLFFWAFMDGGNQDSLSYAHVTSFLKFAAIFGVTALLTYIPKVPAMLKTLVHFIINTVAFVMIISVSGEGSQSARFVSIALFALAYAAVTVAVILLRRVGIKKAEEKVAEDVRAEETEE